MRKLYKRNTDGTLLYHEAWVDGGQVVEHFGGIGDRGQTRTHKLNKRLNDDQNIDKVLQQSMASGFSEVSEEKRRSLVVEYAIDGFGTEADILKRHEPEGRLNETLGWTGLGHCDGGSVGAGTMEVFCPVVDFDIARSVIKSDLAGSKFADFTRIYDSSEG